MERLNSSEQQLQPELVAAGAPFTPQALNTSLPVRTGALLVRCARFALHAEPLLMCGSLVVLAAGEAVAQTTGGGIFGSDQQVGNAIREAIKWGRNLLFLMGVVFVGWGVVNYGTEKPSVKQFVAALGCFAFGGIVALVYSISQGNAVNLDTGFGN